MIIYAGRKEKRIEPCMKGIVKKPETQAVILTRITI